MNISVFFALQFVSQYYSKIEIDGFVDKAVSQINRELPLRFPGKEVTVGYQIVDIDSGRNITDYLLGKIRESDICVFELSDKNPNVLFELGAAYALSKKIVYLIYDTINIKDMPSDLDGKFFRKYNKTNLNIAIAEELYRKVFDFICENRCKLSPFEFDCENDVNIVCPEIPLKYRTSYAEKFSKDYLYKAKFGDPDTLGYVTLHIARIFPKVKINEFVSTEVPHDLFSKSLVCIGGPGWNSVTRDLLAAFEIPIVYGDYSEGVEDFFIKNELNNRVYRTRFSRDGRIISDIGIFGRIPNPHGAGKDIYIINGIQTYGVIGSARSFLEYEFIEKNMGQIDIALKDKHTKYFLAILNLKILEGTVFPTIAKLEDVIFYDEEKHCYTCECS